MIVDHIHNADQYAALDTRIAQAFAFLQHTNFSSLENGKYEIDGENVFVLVQEYQTKDPAAEQLEAHRKYIDVQYMIEGVELMGHAILKNQTPSRAYDETGDYMLFAENPDYFSVISEGMFAIFYPTDLHMPGIRNGVAAKVKKAVVKVKVR